MQPAEHFARLKRLLDLERAAEREENARELERMPISAREALGKTAARLVLDGVEYGAGGYPLLVLSRSISGEELTPFHGMSTGDSVRASLPPGGETASVDGVLERIDEARAWVAV
ncbi:MAG TPA: hypothetical protein VNI01_05290, partial [Elusimicrobiota bacterium]|nr:hypothetical protein [Elusimicrobiota bacterium]